MGIFSRFENKMEDTLEGAADNLSNAPISPVQIAKKAEKQMRREKMVGAGKQYAPTLYTVLVNPDDDRRLFGYYPTLAGETETYLMGKAGQEGLVMDGHPLVRFVVDDSLKHGKFDIIAEAVAAPIVEQLRQEEMARYGIAAQPQYGAVYGQQAPIQQEPPRKPPLPYVPEEEIDRSIDYGEYTFNSEDFEDYRAKASAPIPERQAAMANSAAYQVNSQPLNANSLPLVNANQAVQPQQAYAQPQQAYAQQAAQLGAAPNTVAYAQGNNVQSGRPAVQARIIDIAYRRAYDLAGTRITIGRESGNDIVVQDINASRRHAELRLAPQGVWTITDLRSTNGTIVNGVAVASQALYAGDIITIGKTDLEFTLL